MKWYSKRLQNCYHAMIYRCYHETSRSKYYLHKGITVCDTWLNSPEAYQQWALNNGYREDLVIDRIDPDGNYCPENCRWITVSENTVRAAAKHMVKIGDIEDTFCGWARRLGVHFNCFQRIWHLYGEDEAIHVINDMYNNGIKKSKNANYLDIDGTIKNCRQWSLEAGKSEGYVARCIHKYGEEETKQRILQLIHEHDFSFKGKLISIDNKTMSCDAWDQLCGWCKGTSSRHLKRHGVNDLIKRIQCKLNNVPYRFPKPKQPNQINITVNGITKGCKDWSLFLGKGSVYISRYRRQHGETKTIELIQQFLNAAGGE